MKTINLKKLDFYIKESDIKKEEIAKTIGMSKRNLNYKIAHETLRISELNDILSICEIDINNTLD